MPKTHKQRHDEAIERQDMHDRRTLNEQLRQIDLRPGKSAKERSKILQQLAKEGK